MPRRPKSPEMTLDEWYSKNRRRMGSFWSENRASAKRLKLEDLKYTEREWTQHFADYNTSRDMAAQVTVQRVASDA